jgi:glutamine cyclotransferase
MKYPMRFVHLLFFVFIAILSLNCGNTPSNTQPPFSLNLNQSSYTLGDTLKVSIDNPKQLSIDKITYILDDKTVNSPFILNEFTLGSKILTAKINTEGKEFAVSASFKLYNNKVPDIYGYEIVNTFPHDIDSYTQGLEFYQDELYESTGQYKASKLRKVNFETGEILHNQDLNDRYFGEGLSILNDKIYQLTWKAGTGFIYDVDSFEKIGSFKYGKSKEGWGLCNDGTRLYKSDGTEKIWFLNPKNLTEEKHIEVYTEKGKIPSLNELEWIDGKIFANIYQRNGVVIINPNTGGVEGVIDFKPLKELVTQHSSLDVLNGIAYNPDRGTIFVTGKNWDKLFEVTIYKK